MKKLIFRDDINTVAICVPDTIGRLTGKRVTLARYKQVEKEGLPMPDYHLVNGIENIPYKDLEITGEATGFGNGLLIPVPETCFYLSSEPHTAFIFSEAHNKEGKPVEQAPRRILSQQVERLSKYGIEARMASELEFFLFQKSYTEAHQTGYRELEPYYHIHGDWDVLIGGYAESFIRAIRNELSNANIEIEGYQGEGAPGQYEINIPPASPVKMADKHAIFKHVVKSVAHEIGCAASFMAKVNSRVAGSSCHVHISLSKDKGESFGEAPAKFEESFIAGLLKFSPELTILHAPYENSYRRLRPETFAPCNVSWGWDNRTVMVRLIRQSKRMRIEFRLPGADVNPYLCFAAILAAGIEGIDRKLTLPPAIQGNAYKSDVSNEYIEVTLPSDLVESVIAFSNSELAVKAFSLSVHKHLLDLGIHERDAGRSVVTEWQLARGFERA